MKLVNFGHSQNILIDKEQNEFFFSYETCVAGYTPGEGYWRTTEYYSRTTTKHINRYLDGVNPDKLTMVSPEDIQTALVTF